MSTVVVKRSFDVLNLADAKAHLRVAHAGEDALITALIATAHDFIEKRTRRVISAQTMQASFRSFPHFLTVTGDDTVTVTKLAYIDALGQSQTITLDTLDIAYRDFMTVIRTKDGAWPCTANVMDAVTVEYTVGAADYADIDSTLQQAAKLLVGHWYVNREATSDLSLKDVPMAVDSLLDLNAIVGV